MAIAKRRKNTTIAIPTLARRFEMRRRHASRQRLRGGLDSTSANSGFSLAMATVLTWHLWDAWGEKSVTLPAAQCAEADAELLESDARVDPRIKQIDDHVHADEYGGDHQR